MTHIYGLINQPHCHLQDKPQRPCLCGSGKKYKKCCLK
ncbi:MAG TPA: hypothetical protein ENI99_02515 [Sedimenticola sp.]|nr:hypothetical protein [Sedimenticola sp.]